MNERPILHEADEEQLLDRLVDGELRDPERRALLERFEAVPGGWRRCALAFLEAQSWSQGMRALVNPAASTSTEATPSPVTPGTRQRRMTRVLGAGAALAASLLVAFQLGRSTPDATTPPSGAVVAPSQVADAAPQPAPHRPQTPVRLVIDDSQPVNLQPGTADAWRSEPSPNMWFAPWNAGSDTPVHNVGLTR